MKPHLHLGHWEEPGTLCKLRYADLKDVERWQDLDLGLVFERDILLRFTLCTECIRGSIKQQIRRKNEF